MISPKEDIRKAIEKIIKRTEQLLSPDRTRFYPTQRNWVLLGLTRLTLMIPDDVNLYLADKNNDNRKGGYAVLPISVCTPEGLPDLQDFLGKLGVPNFGTGKQWDWPYVRGEGGNRKPPPARGGTPAQITAEKTAASESAGNKTPSPQLPPAKALPVFMNLVFWVPGFTLPWDVAFNVQQTKSPEKGRSVYTIKDLTPITRLLSLSTSKRLTHWAIIGIRSAGKYTNKCTTGVSTLLAHNIMPQEFITSSPSVLHAEAEYLVFSFDLTTAKYANELRTLLLTNGIEGWQDATTPKQYGDGNGFGGVQTAFEVPQDPVYGMYEYDAPVEHTAGKSFPAARPRGFPGEGYEDRGGKNEWYAASTTTTVRGFQNPLSQVSDGLRRMLGTGFSKGRGMR